MWRHIQDGEGLKGDEKTNVRRLVTFATLGLTLGFVLPIANGQKMYWANSFTEKIQRADLDGANVEDLVTTGLTSPSAMALDLEAGKMYWGEALLNAGGTIRRANLDGSNVEDVAGSEFHVIDIALDLLHGKVYWTNTFDFSSLIQRANLDGSDIEKIASTGLEITYGIAVDAPVGKLYWTRSTFGGPRIQRADLDGSNVEDLVTTGLQLPVKIALDLSARKIYWTDTGTDKIQRANLDGSQVEDLVMTGLLGPTGIALDPTGGKMYWADGGTHKIQRANLDGSNVEDLVTTGLWHPNGIALDLRPSVPLPIPTVSEWGLTGMAALLLAVGSILIRRANPTAKNPVSPRGKRPTPVAAGKVRVVGICAAVLALPLNTNVMGQAANIPTQTVVVSMDSGSVSAIGTGTDPVIVFSRVVSVDGAPWIRVHFQQVGLSGLHTARNESFLRITSVEDGAVQKLDSRSLARWRNSSAYFNGDSVLVELLSYPGTGHSRVMIDHVVAGIRNPVHSESGSTTCGTDPRVTSNDPRAARFLFWYLNPEVFDGVVGCSAFLFDNRPNGFLTAGHCCDAICWPGDPTCGPPGGYVPIVEFNVPPSDPDGTMNFAPSQDQYPLDQASVQCEDSFAVALCPTGQGYTDWCYFGVFQNGPDPANPDTPLKRQQVSYRLATTVPPADLRTLRVTGYGIDSDPPGATPPLFRNQDNQTQQTDTGPYHSNSETLVHFVVWIQPGNSGSGVEDECRRFVYGILSLAGCQSDETDGSGYRVDLPAIQAALDNPQGVCADCNENGVDDTCDVDCMAPGCGAPCGGSADCNANFIPDECEPLGACCLPPFGQCVDTAQFCCRYLGGIFRASYRCATQPFECPMQLGPQPGP